MTRFCFLAERQVGIGSAAGAIEPFIRREPGSEWTDVTYAREGGLLERVPLPGRLGGTLRGIEQVTSALRRGPFDALFFLTHNPAVFQPWALARTPSLLWTDVTPRLLDTQAEQYDHPVDKLAMVSRAKHALVKSTFHRAALCVGWSGWARASFINDYGVPEERTAVVAPGIDLSRWQLPERTPGSGLPRLLFVGGNFVRKGGDLLLDVFRQSLRGRCELDLVTRDPIADEPGVRVHRNLNAGSEPLLALYRQAAAFVLPTRGDCFSIASMEAMAMGLPVVVSDVGGISEIVDASNGYLIPSGSGRDLAAAALALLDDEPRRIALGAAGRRKAEDKFSAERTAARLLELMNQVARKPN
jgi:glycosyltransferase involved in cell wall biosynthesis